MLHTEFDKYRDEYFEIRNLLISQGHILTRDFLPLVEYMADIKEIYKSNMTAIKEADLVIVDTVSNFSIGHQITVALQFRKPTLVLWLKEKHKKFKQMFIHVIESDILQISEYSRPSLEEIIKMRILPKEIDFTWF